MPLECDHIRNEFSALLDSELNPEDRELVEEHLSDCSECLRELHGYKVVSDAYRYHHPVKAPEDFEARFHAAIAPIGRKRSFSWQRWTLAAAAGFTMLAGLAFWQSQFTLKQSATSELALSAPAPEAPPAADAPQSMMFQAPAEGAAPEIMMQESAATSVEAAPAPGQESSDAAGTGPALDGIASTAAVESDNDLSDGVKAKVASEPEIGGGGFGGGGGGLGGLGGRAMPEVAPAEAPAPEMARRTASDAVALKSAPAESDQPALGVTNRDKEERATSRSAMRSQTTESAPAEVAGSAIPAAAPPASPAPVNLLRWNDLEFTLTEGTWRQAGYAGETLTKVSIPSPEWNGLLDRHADLNTLCDRDEPVIVKLGDVWYSIAKSPTQESAPR